MHVGHCRLASFSQPGVSQELVMAVGQEDEVKVKLDGHKNKNPPDLQLLLFSFHAFSALSSGLAPA